MSDVLYVFTRTDKEEVDMRVVIVLNFDLALKDEDVQKRTYKMSFTELIRMRLLRISCKLLPVMLSPKGQAFDVCST